MAEQIKGNINVKTEEETIGKPLEQYLEEYREVREIGKGTMASVSLVERIFDSKVFVSKR